jgi:predicted lipoprotein with Yx(FWY)xxD motif
MHRRQRTRVGASVSVALVAIFAAACTAPSGGGPTSGPTPTAAPAASDPMAEAVTIEATQSSAFGQILTVDGRTVYLFTPDPDDGSETTCLNDCAGNWPAVLVPEGVEPSAGAGVSGALTVIDRPDGGRQVVYANHPLYFFANDAAAGDVNGQGVGGVWYVVSPAGEAVKDAAQATAAPQATDDPLEY